MLERVLAAVADAERTVVVGPRRQVAREVGWRREQPAGSGPVAAIAAALAEVRAATVVVLAADLPDIAPAVPVLRAALDDSRAGVACLVDASGHANYLAAAWRITALRAAVAALPDARGVSVRALLRGTDMIEVPDPDGWGRDCDTQEELTAARARHGEESEMTNPLDAWVTELATELGVDPAAVDRDLLLDVARDAAHNVARPAAPLTTFLVGLAAGARGADAAAVRDAAAIAQRLAAGHADTGTADAGDRER